MAKHTKINAKDHYFLEVSDRHPANTYFHFSFADYYDPENMNFGVLRVLNDDNVKPHDGFNTHPHQNMEIISYIVSGKLTHRDNFGNHEVLSRGHVQNMSAGTGLMHSELNEQTEWCRLLQLWVLPERPNLPVRFGFQKYTLEDRINKLLQILSGSTNKDDAAHYASQDVNIYVSELTSKEKSVNFTLNEGRQAYMYCFEGSINIKDYPSLEEQDVLKIYDVAELEIALSADNAHFMIIEMQLDKAH
jgi:hypothetical protein